MNILLASGELHDVRDLVTLLFWDEPFCVVCGCDEEHACDVGDEPPAPGNEINKPCSWVPGVQLDSFDVDICSACVKRPELADRLNAPRSKKKRGGR